MQPRGNLRSISGLCHFLAKKGVKYYRACGAVHTGSVGQVTPGALSPCPLHRACRSWLVADQDISDPYTAARSPAHAWGFEEE